MRRLAAHLSLSAGTGLLLCGSRAVALAPAHSGAQAVYGSIGGTVTDRAAACCPASPSPSPASSDRPSTRWSPTNRALRQGAAAARRLRGEGRARRLQDRGRAERVESASTRRRRSTSSSRSGSSPRPGDGHRRLAAAQDRPRRRRDALRLEADHRPAGARSQLHQVHPAHARHAAALQWQHAASENPQGSTQTMVNGQHFSGTGYQLDGTENRDPILGIIVINPHARVDRRDEDHLAELRRGVRAGDRGRRLGADQVGHQRLRGSAFEFFQNDAFQARNPFTQFQRRPAHRPVHSRDQAQPVRRLDRRADREEPWFFFGDYQGTRARRAARAC